MTVLALTATQNKAPPAVLNHPTTQMTQVPGQAGLVFTDQPITVSQYSFLAFSVCPFQSLSLNNSSKRINITFLIECNYQNFYSSATQYEVKLSYSDTLSELKHGVRWSFEVTALIFSRYMHCKWCCKGLGHFVGLCLLNHLSQYLDLLYHTS